MSIPDALLNQALVPRLLDPAATVAELLYLLSVQPDPESSYAVVRFADDTYDVVALDDLRLHAGQFGAALLPIALRALPGMLQPGKPVIQAQTSEAQAQREKHERHRRRLVVVNDAGEVVGILVTISMSAPRGMSPLWLINDETSFVLDISESILDVSGGRSEGRPPAPLAPPCLNTRFDGLEPGQPLVVGQRVPLIISVGDPTATNSAQSSRPFAFSFADVSQPVRFMVRVDADPDMWFVRQGEPILIVAPPGKTEQEAEFTIMAKQPGSDKLIISIERDGALVQKIWLPVVAALRDAPAQKAPGIVGRVEASVPLDSDGLLQPQVELTIQSGEGATVVVVHADLPNNLICETYRIPVSIEAIQNATLRLRQELQNIVFYPNGSGGPGPFPFANKQTNTVEAQIAREACVRLADAGWQVWDMLFNVPGGDGRLKQLAEDFRTLPPGSRIRIVLDSHEFILPWALLYDAPGPVNATTIDWSGFWGYRYQIEVFPPGRHPTPIIADVPPAFLLLFNDEQGLSPFTSVQAQYVQQTLARAASSVVWGSTDVTQALRAPPMASLIYCYCHGVHARSAMLRSQQSVTALASESALMFSTGQSMRIADLRQLPAGPLVGQPLVFLNACEGAAQDAFYYDGFMPFFMQQQGARGFIGAEVKAPQLLAHDLGLRFLQLFGEGKPVGEILWQLRRYYLQEHNNILAFNYSLYCPGETRLLNSLVAPASVADHV